jgi:hypothetical protein
VFREIDLAHAADAQALAELVLVLATNGYLTGQTINANGGWYRS